MFWKCMLDKGFLNREVIGFGERGLVVKAWRSQKNEECAVKILDKKDMDASYHKNLLLWLQIKHFHLLPFYGCYSDSKWIYAVMEISCVGNLESFLKGEKLKDGEAKRWIRQVTKGMNYIVSLGFSHGDIKLENVLVFPSRFTEWYVKLKSFKSLKELNGENCTVFTGSHGYQAPEVVRRRPHDAEKADVWSLGVMSYKLLTHGINEQKSNKNINKKTKQINKQKNGKYSNYTNNKIINNTNKQLVFKPKNNWLKFIPQEAGELLKQMIKRKPAQRPTIVEIMNSKWMSDKISNKPSDKKIELSSKDNKTENNKNLDNKKVLSKYY